MMHPIPTTILLVEDDAGIRTLLRVFLESCGYDVVEAQDGYKGLQSYRATSIYAVISDIHMPEMNGLEMIRAIRQDNPDAVIVAMSADPDQLSLAHRAGAHQALRKPFALDELHNVLNGLRRQMGWHKIYASPTS